MMTLRTRVVTSAVIVAEQTSETRRNVSPASSCGIEENLRGVHQTNSWLHHAFHVT